MIKYLTLGKGTPTMRLLFIYFYEKKGTSKEGTIIELANKYSSNDVKDIMLYKKKGKNI